MLSASTARLVEDAAALGERELVRIKGTAEPVAGYRLLTMDEQHRAIRRAESNLVGRRWEMSAVEGLLDRAVDGHGAVVAVVGPPGIGKSRLVREVAAMARRRGVEVFTGFCESHTSQVAFHLVAPLLRAAMGVEGLDGPAARDRVRAQAPDDANAEDLVLLDDLVGYRPSRGSAAQHRARGPSAAVDRPGEFCLVGPRVSGGLRRPRTPTGSTTSASPWSPSSSL